jgi:Oxidoreductase family, C-terminal alpha/beta domain
MDWVGHHVDIAHWGLGFDNTGPHEIEGVGEYPPKDAIWNSATKYKVTANYAGGVVMTIAGGYKEIRGGTKWIGDEGWVWVDRKGLDAEPRSILDSEIKPNEIALPKSPGHYEEFIACVRSRGETLTPARVALRSATPGWLGQIAMLTGKKLKWDPEKMRIIDNPEASKLLSRNMRAPWRLG